MGEEYGTRLRSLSQTKSRITLHLRPELGKLALPDITSARIESLLHRKRGELAAESLNKLRGLIGRLFSCAERANLFHGINPARNVSRRKVPRNIPEYLREQEVVPVLCMLDLRWRPLFATAIHTGMRKGELLGLRRRDVDLEAGTILVARSYDSATTKGGHQDVIPVADSLLPYLEEALEASTSELVFPRADGSMQPPSVKLDHVLRRALGKAGVVNGYTLICRKKGCGFSKSSKTALQERCLNCKRKLWVKPVPATCHVPRPAPHGRDPAPQGQGAACPCAADSPAHRPEADRSGLRTPSGRRLAYRGERAGVPSDWGQCRAPCRAGVADEGTGEKRTPGSNANALKSRGFEQRAWRDSNPRPLASEGTQAVSPGLAPDGSGSQVLEILGEEVDASLDGVAPLPQDSTSHGAPVVRVPSVGDDFLTVREVAARLKVSTATIYALIDRGELAHVRVGNSIRVSQAVLAALAG